ncbi:NADPH:quinone oxidoreductase family protein [Yunchengibacter salinarum]|uniref:NADPH:quinone oxidoreductase family protein n=1 Tax=Yunchengibacter salinarum TaxID=3133399 RepID=UPI0035B67F89
MKAVLCKELGGAEKLVVEDVPAPRPGPKDVLVDVKAAGVNFPDVLIIQGKYQFQPDLPFTPGGEGAGVVAEVGAEVDGIKPGDRVLFTHLTGAFAEQAVVPAGAVVPIPDAMPFDAAAGLTITYATSLHALKQRADLKAGETVLVLGAAGGVGLAAVELAKAMGATVIAATSSEEKGAVARAAGADKVITYSTEDLKKTAKDLTGGRGVDVVYDPVGSDYTEQALRAMAPGGRLLVIGFAAGDIPKVPANLCLLKQCSLVGVFWGAWAAANPGGQADNMRILFDHYAAGRIKPHIDGHYPLDRVADAYERLTGRHARGKVILTPQG